MSDDQFLIDIVSISADTAGIVSGCQKIVEDFKRSAGEAFDFSRPYSIVLSETATTAEKNEDLVDYRTVHNQQYFDRPDQAWLKQKYTETALGGLVAKLPFPFSIMRLSVLPPNTIIGMHTDDACHAQLAITTNDDCFVAARSGETANIPMDGRLYIISTTMPHTAFNASPQERIHLSISIFDEDYVKMLRKA